MNRGIMTTWNGTIMVDNTTMNNKLRPGNLNRANPYATIEHDNTCPTTQVEAMIDELIIGMPIRPKVKA